MTVQFHVNELTRGPDKVLMTVETRLIPDASDFCEPSTVDH